MTGGVRAPIHRGDSGAGNIGTGFAIPIDRATRIADDLIDDERTS
ncbi:hypothetical protein [Flindersiella endophytica]